MKQELFLSKGTGWWGGGGYVQKPCPKVYFEIYWPPKLSSKYLNKENLGIGENSFQAVKFIGISL